MALDTYPWSKKYGWCEDRFGVSWQLMIAPGAQKIVPAFLFVNKLFGRGEEAKEVARMQKPYKGKDVELFIDRIEPEKLFSFKWHSEAGFLKRSC